MFLYRTARALVNVPIKAGDRGSSPQLSNVPTSAGEIKSISKSNEKNVNGNGNSPGGRTREKLGVVKFRVICYTKNFDIEYIAKLYNTNFSVH